MDIVVISDTHTMHHELDIPESGDVIVHSGDCSISGKKQQINDFLYWFASLDYKMKIFVPGNHDWGFQTHTDEYKQKCEDLDITLLMDSGMQYKKVNFWGSPATPEFNNWAFNYARNPWESTMERPFIGNCWNKIPLNTDILITHGPPYGILDRNMNGMPCGCEILAETIGIVKPTMHLFGHIHEGNGVIVKGDITYVNASCLNASYRLYPVHYRRFDWEKVRNGERYGSY